MRDFMIVLLVAMVIVCMIIFGYWDWRRYE